MTMTTAACALGESLAVPRCPGTAKATVRVSSDGVARAVSAVGERDHPAAADAR
jgi:transposase InsO family protein